MHPKLIAVTLILVVLLTACNVASSDNLIVPTPTTAAIPTTASISTSESSSSPSSLPATSQGVVSLPVEQSTSAHAFPVSANQAVMDLAFETIQAIKNKDIATLSTFVHPTSGVRFSPYAFVQDSHQLFSAQQVAGLLSDSTVYNWGNYSGTGEPINLTFADYYAKFVYDVDFANAPQLSLNHRLSSGNSSDNAAEYYPGSMVVEFYFPGFDPQYDGMDWRSLRLVFSDYNGQSYLVGVIHDEWTP